MSRATIIMKNKVFFFVSVSLFVLTGLLTLTGCKHLNAIYGHSSYTVDTMLVDRESAKVEMLQGYKDYSGKVAKISPLNGRNWADFSKAIYWDWDQNETGSCKITVSMSVLVESPNSGRPVISAYRPTDKTAAVLSGIKWNGPANIGWTIQSESGFYDQFGGKAVEVPEGRWVDLTFSESFDLAGIGSGQIYLDGHNDHQGLLDLTLYVRHFEVTTVSSQNYVALTFNNCPTDFTGYLLDKLDELNVKATFFVSGMGIDALHPVYDRTLAAAARRETAEERRGLIKRMFDEGHELANLSYSQNYLGGGKLDGKDGIDPLIQKSDIPLVANYSVTDYPLSEAAIRKELEDTQIAIQRSVYGGDDYMKRPPVSKFFRMPLDMDLSNAVTLTKVTREMGLPIIGGTGTRANNAGKNAAELAAAFLKEIKPWSICMNGDPRTDPSVIAVLDILVPKLKAEGYLFITLSEMAKRRVKVIGYGEIYNDFDPNR